MSEEICENCGKPLSECTCNIPVKERVVVEHRGLPEPTDKDLRAELEAERKRREDLELVVEAEAMKDFEDRKKAFLDLIPDEDERKKLDEKIGDDNERLEEYQRMTSFLKDALESAGVTVTDEKGEPYKKPTVGKARLQKSSEGLAQSGREYVDNLYAILKDEKASMQEKEIANQRLDQLFFEMIRGINVAHRGRKPFAGFSITSCPQCGSALIGERGQELDSCPKCGWSLWSKQARRG